MIKRVLVDLSDTLRVRGIVEQATDVARRHQAEVTAIVETGEDGAVSTGKRKAIAAARWAKQLRQQSVIDARETMMAAVDELRSHCSRQGIPFQIVERERDSMAETVDEFQFYDLFICGTNLSFEDTSLESGSEELIRMVEQGVRPVLAVSDEFRPVKRVLATLSGATDSARTLKQFVRLKICPDAMTEIVCFSDDERSQRLMTEATRYCRRHGVEPQCRVLQGPMNQSLLPHAVESEADLIVLGNSDHGRLARWFFGGTVMDIIRESDRSLFLSQ